MDEEKSEIEEEKQVSAEPVAKKSMLGLWVVIVVVLLIIVGTLAYWLGKNASTDDQTTLTPVATGSVDMLTATAPADDSATTTTDVTADWKTYTNDTYGVSFKYPKSWTISDNIPINLSDSKESSPTEYLQVSDQSSTQKPILSIWVNPTGFGPFFPDKEYSFNTDKGQMIVDKVTTPDYSNQQGMGDPPNADGVEFISGQSSYKGFNYLLFFQYVSGNTDLEQTYRQILSTFQFTK